MKTKSPVLISLIPVVTLVLLGIIIGSQTARASGPWYVANFGSDFNDCASPVTPCGTIKKAISLASNGQEIYVASGTYMGPGDEVVYIDKSVTISGGWSDDFTTQDGVSVIDGQDSRAGIYVISDMVVYMEDFTIQNGSNSGIRNGGSLTLVNSTITENHAIEGGGIFNGQNATLILDQVTTTGNSASSRGGGIYISQGGIFTATNSIFSWNTTGTGGGIYINLQSTVLISGSLITNNSTSNNGGGIQEFAANVILKNTTISRNSASSKGGGLFHYDGSLDLNNSTISSNSAGYQGGGLFNYGGASSLNSTTVSNNQAASGGGIYRQDGTVILQNTILANNQADNNQDCTGVVDSLGYNLIGNTTGCTFSPTTGDQTNVDPILGELVGPPGIATYHPIMASSPAIDAGNPGGCTDHLGNPLLTDQRGFPRSGVCDTGAYEYFSPGSPDIFYTYSGTPQRANINYEFKYPLRAAVLDAQGSPVGDVLVTYTAPETGASGVFSDTGTFTTSIVTNQSGIATSSSFTANGIAGTYMITGTIEGSGDNAVFYLTNTSWFVSTLGADSNDCQTSDFPCATINEVLLKPDFSEGDTIMVASGTYTGTGDVVVTLNKDVRLQGGWDETFTSQSGAVIIDGENTRRGISVGSSVLAAFQRFSFENGSANDGGGIYNQGILTLRDSSISHNFVTSSGGGILNKGSLVLINSTISQNNSNFRGGGIFNEGDISLNSSTISANNAKSYGGGISNFGNTIILANTILARNTAPDGPECYWGSLTSAGYNLVEDTSNCTFNTATGDLTNVDAKLGVLVSTPGYHPLLSASPAVDQGDPAGCKDDQGVTLTNDQRGGPRVGRCDIGAYEYTTPGPAAQLFPYSGTPQRTPPFTNFQTNLQAVVLDSIGSPVSNTLVTFSAPSSGPSGTFIGTGSPTSNSISEESGIASAIAFTANDLTGSYTVMATISGLGEQANFELSNFGWYVSPSGKDSNDCLTPSTTCKLIHGPLSKGEFISGDTVLVAVGTYTNTGGEVVLVDKDTRFIGGWNEIFSHNKGISTIDGQSDRRGIKVNQNIETLVENFVIQNGSASTGGGIYVEGSLILIQSTVQRNIASQGGGIHNYGGNVTLNRSTVNNNRLIGTSSGGGIYNQGEMYLNNSTISENKGGGGGGIGNNGNLSIYNSTITKNTALSGGGINGGATLQNTILAGNNNGWWGDCVVGTFVSLGYNLVGDADDCNFTPTTGDLINIDANLGDLIGTPGYHPLLSGSPAIDAGNPIGCTDNQGQLLVVDQRGAGRVGFCDMGAYEYTTPGPAALLTFLNGASLHTPPGHIFWLPLEVAVVDSIGSPVSTAVVNYTTPITGPGGVFGDTGTYTSTSVTSETGIAVTPPFSANAITGSYTITASTTGVFTPAHHLLSNLGWYVTPGGDDSNDCQSPGTACAIINEVLLKPGFMDGDTVLTGAGIYTGTGDEVVFINRDVRLIGGWDNSFNVQNGETRIDGGEERRGMELDWFWIAELDKFVIQNGLSISNGAGGIFNRGDLSIVRSTIDSNRAGTAGGGIYNYGILSLSNSAVVNNRGDDGGGIYNQDTLNLDNVTMSNNRAMEGGAVYSQGTFASINSTTIVSNTTTYRGGSVYNDGTGLVEVQNTIITGDIQACGGTIDSLGYNLIDDLTGCDFVLNSGDQTGIDPELGQLIGSPPYHHLFGNSPAINAGNPSGCTDHTGELLLVDQRGANRVDRCDIGAYEYAIPGSAASIYPFSGTPQHSPPGFTYSEPLEAVVLDDIGSPVSEVLVTFTSPVESPSGTFTGTNTNTISATTDINGVATSSLFTADGYTGTYTVTATVPGASEPAIFHLSNLGWYVTTTGNDNKDCQSPTTACGTINAVLDKPVFFPGDVVFVEEGTYVDTGAEVVLLDVDVVLSGGWDSAFSTQVGVSRLDGESSHRVINQTRETTGVIDHFVVMNGKNYSSGGGIYVDDDSTLILNNSTVRDNYSVNGGGLYTYRGTIIVNNSSVSNNQASSGGGGSYTCGTLELNNVTVTDNKADVSGGVYCCDGTVTIQNTIVAGNTATSVSDDCRGTITSAGYNLIGDKTDCTYISTTGDLIDVDPRMLPVQGSFDYWALIPGSPAIDTGNPIGCVDHLGHTLSTDQRGGLRPVDGNGDSITICDIGAYEYDRMNDPLFYAFLPQIFHNYCNPLYSDNFSDPGSGWRIEDTGDVEYAYLNGEYRMLLKQPNWVSISRPGFTMDNFVLNVNLRNATGTYGSYGLVFGLSNDWTEFYSFEIDPDGYYMIWKFQYGVGWTLLAVDYSGSIKTGTQSNLISLVRDGNLIEAFANGDLLVSLVDGSYIGIRHVGLIATTWDYSNVDARYDNFTVLPLQCRPGGGSASVSSNLNLQSVEASTPTPGLMGMPNTREE